MGRFRLRHEATELELPEGEFVIGRSTQCHLTLDDALVSRRHARFVQESEQLFVEDLGSRNGYLLNGVETRVRSPVRHLDRIRIGNHDLVVLDDRASDRVPRQTSTVCRMCGSAVVAGTSRCSVCNTPVSRGPHDNATLEIQIPPELRRGDSPQRGAFALVGNIASKALALGRIEEGERMLSPLLDSLEKRIVGGESIDGPTLREAIDFATKLLEGPNAARWVGWLLQTHTALRKVPEATLVDTLHEVVRRVRYADSKPVARLVESVNNLANLSAGDRFVIKRLESLQRVISA